MQHDLTGPDPETYELLAQLSNTLDLAIDQGQPYRTTARVTSIAARLDVAARGGADGAHGLVRDLAYLSAGWRRADAARTAPDAEAWGYVTDSGA
jgi:hypothetical protein